MKTKLIYDFLCSCSCNVFYSMHSCMLLQKIQICPLRKLVQILITLQPLKMRIKLCNFIKIQLTNKHFVPVKAFGRGVAKNTTVFNSNFQSFLKPLYFSTIFCVHFNPKSSFRLRHQLKIFRMPFTTVSIIC